MKISVWQPSPTENLPSLKTPQVKTEKNKIFHNRSKSRDKLRELDLIKEREKEQVVETYKSEKISKLK